jgi:hypothetical protein
MPQPNPLAAVVLQNDELEVLLMGLEALQQRVKEKIPTLAEDPDWLRGLAVLHEKLQAEVAA